MYDLQAVVHHLGTAHGGHYMTFVRDTNDSWIRYNDANVSTVTGFNVLTSGAYVLSCAKRCGTGVA